MYTRNKKIIASLICCVMLCASILTPWATGIVNAENETAVLADSAANVEFEDIRTTLGQNSKCVTDTLNSTIPLGSMKDTTKGFRCLVTKPIVKDSKVLLGFYSTYRINEGYRLTLTPGTGNGDINWQVDYRGEDVSTAPKGTINVRDDEMLVSAWLSGNKLSIIIDGQSIVTDFFTGTDASTLQLGTNMCAYTVTGTKETLYVSAYAEPDESVVFKDISTTLGKNKELVGGPSLTTNGSRDLGSVSNMKNGFRCLLTKQTEAGKYVTLGFYGSEVRSANSGYKLTLYSADASGNIKWNVTVTEKINNVDTPTTLGTGTINVRDNEMLVSAWLSDNKLSIIIDRKPIVTDVSYVSPAENSNFTFGTFMSAYTDGGLTENIYVSAYDEPYESVVFKDIRTTLGQNSLLVQRGSSNNLGNVTKMKDGFRCLVTKPTETGDSVTLGLYSSTDDVNDGYQLILEPATGNENIKWTVKVGGKNAENNSVVKTLKTGTINVRDNEMLVSAWLTSNYKLSIIIDSKPIVTDVSCVGSDVEFIFGKSMCVNTPDNFTEEIYVSAYAEPDESVEFEDISTTFGKNQELVGGPSKTYSGSKTLGNVTDTTKGFQCLVTKQTETGHDVILGLYATAATNVNTGYRLTLNPADANGNIAWEVDYQNSGHQTSPKGTINVRDDEMLVSAWLSGNKLSIIIDGQSIVTDFFYATDVSALKLGTYMCAWTAANLTEEIYVSAYVADSAVQGDCNNDGITDIRDIVRNKRYQAGTMAVNNQADLNDDTNVNDDDIKKIYDILLEDVLVMDDGSGDVVKKLTKSGFNLIENKTTNYKIVIPDDPVDMVNEAAQELQYFLSEATGVKLEIVKDSEMSGTDYVISLGHTNVAERLGVTTTEENNLGMSGYYIKTVGKSIVIMDAVDSLQEGYGVLCGVYGFLEDAIGLVVYTMDEIFYEKLETVPLYSYDEVVKPSFDVRFVEGAELRSDETYSHRMKLLNYGSEDWWPLQQGHSQVHVVLPYKEDHKDWYTSDGNQLCWSAGEDLEQAFAESVIDIIKKNPNGVYFMLGQEDFVDGCTCEKCKDNISADKYGSYSGLQIVFLNNVIEIVEAWRAENAPERDIRYVCYAYAYTLDAPTKTDASGNIVPYKEECRPSDKLYIRYAPLEADFSKAMEDPANERFRKAAEGWAAIAPGRVSCYLYGANFRNWFLNFNNFDSMQNHYKFYSDLGVDFMYSHAVMNENVAAFKEMRVFVESQLLWNVDLNYDKLVNKFMLAYYKDAAQEMRKYYDCIKKIYDDAPNVNSGYVYASIGDAYTIEDVEEMDKYIKEALQAIEHLCNTDYEQYKTLYYRIKKEELSVLWLKLEKFGPFFDYFYYYYSKQELNDFTVEFYNLCEKFVITCYKSEGQSFPIDDRFFKYLLDE